MAEIKSNVPYKPLNLENNSDLTDIFESAEKSVTIVLNSPIHHSQTIWQLKLCGCFVKNNYIFSLALLYHICNISFAIWTFFIHDGLKWCIWFKITLFVIQIESFLLYCLGYHTLNKQRNDKYVNITLLLQNKHKSAPICIKLGIAFSILTVFGTSIVTYLESLANYNHTRASSARKYCQLTLYLCDFIKWVQMAMIVLIIFGFLNTFSDKMNQFKRRVNSEMHRIHLSMNSNKIAMNSISLNTDATSAYNNENNPNPLMKFKTLDQATFMKEYHKAMDYYRIISKEFCYFIAAFCVFNFLVWLSLVLSVAFAFSDSNQCQTHNLIFFFIHYSAEIVLYFVLWFVILWRMNRNHTLIEKYKTVFRSKVIPINGSNDKDQIVAFLQNELDNNSPFAIIGMNPTAKKIGFLFLSVLVPLSLAILKFVIQVEKDK